MIVSAVVLSAKPINVVLPDGIALHPHVSAFSKVEALLDARFDAVLAVRSPWCFYLDDDDVLPADADDVIKACLTVAQEKKLAMVSTDELIVSGETTERSSRRHHLVLMKTTIAQACIRRLPRGRYHAEGLLYPELEKQGHAHVDRVGYIWNKGVGGMHANPFIVEAICNSMIWHQRQSNNKGTL